MCKWEDQLREKGITKEVLSYCGNLNNEVSAKKKELEALKKKIKSAMLEADLSLIENGDFTAKISHRVKKTVDEDMLYAFLDSKGLISETTETKVVFVESKINKAIEEGKISESQVELCKKATYSDVFTIK